MPCADDADIVFNNAWPFPQTINFLPDGSSQDGFDGWKGRLNGSKSSALAIFAVARRVHLPDELGVARRSVVVSVDEGTRGACQCSQG